MILRLRTFFVKVKNPWLLDWLLTLVAMEPPASMDAESLRDEKVKVLKSIRPIPKEAVHAHAFRAQYASGIVEGKRS